MGAQRCMILLLTYQMIICMKKFKNPKNKWSTNTQAKLFTMKYYGFGRRRKNHSIPFTSISKKESLCLTNTDRSKMLESEENYQTDQQY